MGMPLPGLLGNELVGDELAGGELPSGDGPLNEPKGRGLLSPMGGELPRWGNGDGAVPGLKSPKGGFTLPAGGSGTWADDDGSRCGRAVEGARTWAAIAHDNTSEATSIRADPCEVGRGAALPCAATVRDPKHPALAVPLRARLSPCGKAVARQRRKAA
jgi:hypothetical protein